MRSQISTGLYSTGLHLTRSVVSLLPSTAAACPNCRTAREVRASVFGDASFWPQLLLVLLPMLVIAAVAACLHRLGRDRTDEYSDPPNSRG
jgi:hypothetical protein